MKILHISPSYYPAFNFGGPIRSVHSLNKQLVKDGIEVDVLTTNVDLKEKVLANQWVNLDGCRVMYLPYFGYEHYNFSISYLLKCAKIIRNYDIVHITGIWNFQILVATLFASIWKIPYIISCRGALNQTALESKSAVIKKIYYYLFAKHYLLKANYIHFTTTDEMMNSSFLLDVKKNIVIPNGINTPINFVNKGKLKEEYLLYLGRIHPIKGLELLIKSVKDIVSDNLKLFIVGPDNTGYKTKLYKLISELKLENYVIIKDPVLDDDKWTLLKNAKIFILPSFSENFGMSVLESMEVATPTIISNKVGLWRELKDNNAAVISEQDEISLNKNIKELLADEKKQIEISRNAQKLVKEYYDIKSVSKMFIEKYKNLINK